MRAPRCSARSFARSCRGQSSVELLALLPLLATVALAAAQLLAAGVARTVASSAAEAGAMAILQGGDPVDAARGAAPRWSRERLAVEVVGRRVRVRVRPPGVLPGTSQVLTATAQADAGPPA
jgi:hypothetical protein